ncbi:hypothetical protein C8R45DRAFT_948099 [Mycena sanguinolenta]|nr:hypothetical protein C8R45DRAFT_948099 [Mycena sanguinolenta]
MNERGPICKSLPVEATQQYGLATTGNEYYTLTLNSIEKPRLQTEPLPYKEILWKSTGIRKRNEKPTYGSYGRIIREIVCQHLVDSWRTEVAIEHYNYTTHTRGAHIHPHPPSDIAVLADTDTDTVTGAGTVRNSTAEITVRARFRDIHPGVASRIAAYSNRIEARAYAHRHRSRHTYTTREVSDVALAQRRSIARIWVVGFQRAAESESEFGVGVGVAAAAGVDIDINTMGRQWAMFSVFGVVRGRVQLRGKRAACAVKKRKEGVSKEKN